MSNTKKVKNKFKYSEKEKSGRHLYDFIAGHEKVTSRRQFMSLGLMASASSFILPSLPFGNLHAFTCNEGDASGGSGGGGSLPVSVGWFDGAGGFNSTSYIMDSRKPDIGTGYLVRAGYERQSLIDNMVPFANRRQAAAGNQAFLVNGSPFSDSMIQAMGEDFEAITQNLLYLGATCDTNNDTSNNATSACAQVAELQSMLSNGYLTKKLLNREGGSFNAVNGRRFQGISAVSVAPTRLSNNGSLEDILGLVKSGELATVLEGKAMADQIQNNFFNTFLKIQESLQNRYLAANKFNQKLAEKNFCLFKKTSDNIVQSNPQSIQQMYQGDADINAVFGNDIGNINNADDARIALAMKTLQNQHSGQAVNVFGGCDYHNNNVNSNVNAQTTIGDALGKALRYAYRKGMPFIAVLSSDGGASARDNSNLLTNNGAQQRCAVNENSNQYQTHMMCLNPPGSKFDVVQFPRLGNWLANGTISSSAAPKIFEPTNLGAWVFWNITLFTMQDFDLAWNTYVAIMQKTNASNPFTKADVAPGGAYAGGTIV
jgi:hypothetical protein